MKIMSVQHLCSIILSSSVNVVENIIFTKSNEYKAFEIEKKNGRRIIHSINKDGELYKMQKLLVDNFFSQLPIPTPSKGFVKRSSYSNFLNEHIGQKNFIRVDIKDFFGNLSKELFEEIFTEHVVIIGAEESKECKKILWELCTLKNKVPQGAVTSPSFSNILFSRIDQRLLKYCQNLNIKYTRYADDLLFSSENFDFSVNSWFLKKVRYIIGDKGFSVNYSKLKVSNSGELGLNGFVISSNEIRLSRKRLAKLRGVMYQINDYLETNLSPSRDSLMNYLNTHQEIKNLILFDSFPYVLMFLKGYRAHLIDWLTDENSNNSKKIARTINQIENLLEKMIKLH